jgi:TRAP-type C4-dicarboxylate transport system permease small subunit
MSARALASPPASHRRIDRILAVWSRIETAGIGLLVLAALVVFLGGAALRVLAPRWAIDWADEVALYFIIWGTLIAGSVLAAEQRHIHTEILVSQFPRRVRRLTAVAIGGLTFGFCGVMAWYGWEAFAFSLMLDDRSGSSLRTPQAWALFLPLPVGMGLLTVKIILLALAGRGITAPEEYPAPEGRGG